MKIRKVVVLEPTCPPLEENSNEDLMVWSIRSFADYNGVSIEESFKLHYDHSDIYKLEVDWEEVKERLNIK